MTSTTKLVLLTVGIGIGLGLIAFGLVGVQVSHMLWGE